MDGACGRLERNNKITVYSTESGGKRSLHRYGCTQVDDSKEIMLGGVNWFAWA
jgi:hypothetical protein